MKKPLLLGVVIGWSVLVATSCGTKVDASAPDKPDAHPSETEDGAPDAGAGFDDDAGWIDASTSDATHELTCPGSCIGPSEIMDYCDFNGACRVSDAGVDAGLCEFSVQNTKPCGDCFGCGEGCECIDPDAHVCDCR